MIKPFKDNNLLISKLENEDEKKRSFKNIPRINNISSIINNIFFFLFLVLSVLLFVSLIIYFRFNSNNLQELSYVNDLHKLKAYIKSVKINKDFNLKIKNETPSYNIGGYIEINEVFEGIAIEGKVYGLNKGSTHAMHIIEYSDIIDDQETSIKNNDIYYLKKDSDIKLNHYNPLKLKHSCPSTNNEQNYHFGDLGNIIANNEGNAFISVIKKISLKSLNGRLIIITNSPDICKEDLEIDSVYDIIGIGVLSIFKPIFDENLKESKEFYKINKNEEKKKEIEKIDIISINNKNDSIYFQKEIEKENKILKMEDNSNLKENQIIIPKNIIHNDIFKTKQENTFDLSI